MDKAYDGITHWFKTISIYRDDFDEFIAEYDITEPPLFQNWTKLCIDSTWVLGDPFVFIESVFQVGLLLGWVNRQGCE